MTFILETPNYIVEAADRPHVDRCDRGHIRILPKQRVVSRTELSPELAVELMRLSMIVGEAMEVSLQGRGIDIGRINYQENGNWGVFKPDGPYLHLHICGRARSVTQAFFKRSLSLDFGLVFKHKPEDYCAVIKYMEEQVAR